MSYNFTSRKQILTLRGVYEIKMCLDLDLDLFHFIDQFCQFLQKFPFFDIDQFRQEKLIPTMYVWPRPLKAAFSYLWLQRNRSSNCGSKGGWVALTSSSCQHIQNHCWFSKQLLVRVAKKHCHQRAIEDKFEEKEQERGLWREPKQRWVDVFCSLPAATKQVALKQTLAGMPRLLVHLLSITVFHCVRVYSNS